MKDLRINLIGASGAGKSTLAAALAQKFGIKHFDTDFYYHEETDPPFQIQRTPLDRYNLIMNDLSPHSSWVLSGAVGAWQPTPKLDYTLVVLLYLPPEIRLERLKMRESNLYGDRIKPGGDMEADHQFFMKWTSGYDDGTSEGTNTLGHHEEFFKKLNCKVLKFDRPMTTEEQLQRITEFLQLK